VPPPPILGSGLHITIAIEYPLSTGTLDMTGRSIRDCLNDVVCSLVSDISETVETDADYDR